MASEQFTLTSEPISRESTVQVNEPGTSVHMALVSQGLELHSLMSENM